VVASLKTDTTRREELCKSCSEQPKRSCSTSQDGWRFGIRRYWGDEKGDEIRAVLECELAAFPVLLRS